MRTLNIHKFTDTAAADEYVGGCGELCKVQEDGSEPSLRLHDGTTPGGFEVSCDCSQADCSDACKQYVDDAVHNIVVGGAPAVIGIVLAQEGGGAGVWQRVDINGQPIEVPAEYFDYHPIYRAIHRVQFCASIYMQEHSKFYFKAMKIQDGPFAGKTARMISPYKVDESWKVYPSFMKNGKEIDKWWCGSYQAEASSRAYSQDISFGSNVNVYPITPKPDESDGPHFGFEDMRLFCQNANTRVPGATGFDMWNIYQWSEICLLALIEAGTPDTQNFYGRGWVDASTVDVRMTTDATVAQATWRGHVGLWGNVIQKIVGLVATSNQTYKIWKNDGTEQFVETNVQVPVATDGYDGWYYLKSLADASGDGYDFNEVFVPSELTAVLDEASIPDGYIGRHPTLPTSLVDSVCQAGVSSYGDTYAHVGGPMTLGDKAGLFSLAINVPIQCGKVLNSGTRLSKTPGPAE